MCETWFVFCFVEWEIEYDGSVYEAWNRSERDNFHDVFDAFGALRVCGTRAVLYYFLWIFKQFFLKIWVAVEWKRFEKLEIWLLFVSNQFIQMNLTIIRKLKN